jgi:hypothetical protein
MRPIIIALIIIAAVIVVGVIIYAVNTTGPTGSATSGNCGGSGQPSCEEYCTYNPTAPECSRQMPGP